MKKFMKGMVIALFTLVMTYVFIPADTFALNGNIAGSGSAEDPYLIEDLADLKAFVDPWSGDYKDKVVKLTNDIVADGKVTIKHSFAGTFEGDNHSITGLTNPIIGTNNGTINNLRLIKSNIVLGKDSSNIGGLVNINNGLIDGCSSEGGSITSNDKVNDIANIGGLVGINSGTIRNSFNTSNISIKKGKDFKAENVGGLAGKSIGNGSILNCYNWGNIEAKDDVGGIAGDLDSTKSGKDVNQPEVDNVYNKSKVNAEKDKDAGALVGDNNESAKEYKPEGKVSGYEVKVEKKEQKLVGDRENTKEEKKNNIFSDEDKELQELLKKLNNWVDQNNKEGIIYKHWYIKDKYPIFAPYVVITFLAGENGTIGALEEEILINTYVGAAWNDEWVPLITANEGWVEEGWDDEFPETVTESKTFTAMYSKDENNDGIADKYQVKIYFEIVNGTWEDGSKNVITVWVTLYDEEGNPSETGVGELTDDMIPSGMKAFEGYGNGSWNKKIVKDITARGTTTYTYTFKDLGGTGSTTPVITNPNTSDNPFTYIFLTLISLIGMIIIRKNVLD